MSVDVKICGLMDFEGVNAAVGGGARYLGFVFCLPSRRWVAPSEAAALLYHVPPSFLSVGLFVNPSDDALLKVLEDVPLNVIQLHGSETPQRVADVGRLTKLPVMKAIGMTCPEDLDRARSFEPMADYLLFDAQAPAEGPSGGNGKPFDWALIEKQKFSKPWMLAGGLDIDNIEEAVVKTGAKILDVSSGVEDETGRKSPEKIKAFLEKARALETCC